MAEKKQNGIAGHVAQRKAVVILVDCMEDDYPYYVKNYNKIRENLHLQRFFFFTPSDKELHNPQHGIGDKLELDYFLTGLKAAKKNYGINDFYIFINKRRNIEHKVMSALEYAYFKYGARLIFYADKDASDKSFAYAVNSILPTQDHINELTALIGNIIDGEEYTEESTEKSDA